ncbi:MAG: hypothetical protein ACI9U2_004503 [Bradymonadia bacterium]|jgi:hypothetical protein
MHFGRLRAHAPHRADKAQILSGTLALSFGLG